MFFVTPKQQSLRFLQVLFKKCHENETLKKALLKKPIQTLEKLTGKPNKLPIGYSIKVEDQSNPECMYFNIPLKPKNLNRQ